jgi:O-antigen ligase
MGVWIAYEPVVNYLNGAVVEHGYGGIAYGRFGDASGHVALANTLAQGLPLVYYQAEVQKGRHLKILLFGIILFMVFGILITRSRGGVVGIIAIVAGIYIFKSNTKRNNLLFFIFGVLILVVLFLDDQYIDRILSLRQGFSSGRSSNDRYMGLVNGISMMIKRPILGVGIGCYAEARRYFFNYYFYSHNLYGELFGELGILSAVWFYWVYTIFASSKYIKYCVKKAKSNVENNDFKKEYMFHIMTAVQVGIIVRLILGMGSHSAFIWYWFMMAALSNSAWNIMKENKNLHSGM